MDALLFGRVKSAQKFVLRIGANSTENEDLARILKAHGMSIPSTTAKVSWIRLEFEYCKRHDPFY
jgi:hypothetical protein